MILVGGKRPRVKGMRRQSPVLRKVLRSLSSCWQHSRGVPLLFQSLHPILQQRAVPRRRMVVEVEGLKGLEGRRRHSPVPVLNSPRDSRGEERDPQGGNFPRGELDFKKDSLFRVLIIRPF